MADLNYNWGTVIATDEGGDAVLKISSAYDIIYRDGSAVRFKWGIRFETIEGLDNTRNSIVMRYDYGEGEKNVYAVYSPNKNGWIPDHKTPVYVSSDSPNNAGYYPNEHLYSTSTWHADSHEAGFFTVRVGVAWDKAIPTASRYMYEFNVWYPAAEEYTIRYYANGGTGGPSTQTKYQGYSTYLTSSKPTRSGYKFIGWNTRSDGSGIPWSSGEYYNDDSGMALYAQWETTTPIFTPPTLSRTETTISWSNFSINIDSYVYYRLDEESSWVYLGYGTYGFSGAITDLEASSYHTIYFKAENMIDTSRATINNVSTTTYSYPYITGISVSPIEAGSTQTISIYNPLNRAVVLKICKIEDYDNENTIYEYGTFGSTITSSTSGSFTVPIESIARVVTHNWRAWALYALEYNGVRQSTQWGVVRFPTSIGPVIDTNMLWNDFFSYSDCARAQINGSDRSLSTFTGSTRRFIRGLSKFRYYLDPNVTPATTYYGAEIGAYYVTLNGKALTWVEPGQYYYQDAEGASTTNADNAATVPEDIGNYSIEITIVDSRGMSTSDTFYTGTQPYSWPSATITSIARNDGYGTKATLQLSGNWGQAMWGSQAGRYIRLDYRPVGTSSWTYYYLYQNSDGSLGETQGYKELTGIYPLDDIDFDSGTAYEIRVRVCSGIGNSSYSSIEKLSLGTPLLFLDEYQDGVGVNCFPTGKGLAVDGFGHFTGEITANNISASGHLVASDYIQTLTNLYVGGSIYQNGYSVLDTGGGLMKGPIELGTTGSHSNLILRRVNSYSGAGIGIDYQDREAVAIWTSRNDTAFRWHAGIDMTNMTDGMMLGITPDFEVTKNNNGTQPQIYKGGKPVPAVYIQSSAPDSTNLQVGDIWFVL